MDWTRGATIGRGSSAIVSIATCRHSSQVLAVKSTELCKSEFLQKEQRILSSLNSPYVVSYKGCDTTTENNKIMYNLFMEYAEGGTLSDEIRRHGGRLDEPMIVYYTRRILQGLEYIHSNGLVHCDIKGRNILITKTGAKTADFGCSKWKADDSPSGGTPAYMAPEVARGEHRGFASDIWALGCTVIEMGSGTGSVPWSNVTDPVTLLYRVGYSGALPEFPGYLSEKAMDFLSKCLRTDPNERWTANQLLKHPFIEEFNSLNKEINPINSNSPTSILDQGIWNSVEEEEEESWGNLDLSSLPKKSPSERIRKLASSGEPSWENDESWITIRDETICGSELDSDVSGGLEEEEEGGFFVNNDKFLGFLGSEMISTEIFTREEEGGFLGFGVCEYGKDCGAVSSCSSNLNFERRRDRLFSHLNTRFLPS